MNKDRAPAGLEPPTGARNRKKKTPLKYSIFNNLRSSIKPGSPSDLLALLRQLKLCADLTYMLSCLAITKVRFWQHDLIDCMLTVL